MKTRNKSIIIHHPWGDYNSAKLELYINNKLIPRLIVLGLIPIGIAIYGLTKYLLER